jgi:hypothetical protein
MVKLFPSLFTVSRQAGCSAHEIAAITGHGTLKEIERFNCLFGVGPLLALCWHFGEQNRALLEINVARQSSRVLAQNCLFGVGPLLALCWQWRNDTESRMK